jgi:hypothetical protein
MIHGEHSSLAVLLCSMHTDRESGPECHVTLDVTLLRSSPSADSAAFPGHSSRSKVTFGLNLHQPRVRREIENEKYLGKGVV